MRKRIAERGMPVRTGYELTIPAGITGAKLKRHLRDAAKQAEIRSKRPNKVTVSMLEQAQSEMAKKIMDMNDEELFDAFVKMAGIKQDNTKASFRKLSRPAQEDAVMLLYDRRMRG